MPPFPQRLLLDTNIFILAFLEPDSSEAELLNLLEQQPETILIFSNDLDEQLRRMGRRLQDTESP